MRNRLPLVFVLTLLLGGLMPMVAHAAVADTTITFDVQDALRNDSRVDASELTVTTKEGVVTLSGTVDDLGEKQYAVLEAKKINGVVGVLDEITVSSSFQVDSDIQNAVRRRILNSAVITSQTISVDCKEGVVTIAGKVDSYAESQQAGLLAREVRGVKQVRNNIVTVWPGKRSDQEIKGDVVSALKRDVYLTDMPIAVTVKDGVVTLTGSVGNAYEKECAYTDARWIANVNSVENNLTVKWYVNNGAREPAKTLSNSALKTAIRETLDQDIRINAENITLRVAYGDVTLDGFVYTYYERELAKQDASNVVGVAWVTNNLSIHVAPRATWQIADDIDFNLATDTVTDAFGLKASVVDGVATLTGTVHTWFQWSHAYDVAARVRGVKRVVNNIVVSSRNWKKEADLVNAVRSRLKSDWTTWWVSKKINVTVNDGVATLEGNVNSWKERQKAGEEALHTIGIYEVDNRLAVKGVDYPWDEHYYK